MHLDKKSEERPPVDVVNEPILCESPKRQSTLTKTLTFGNVQGIISTAANNVKTIKRIALQQSHEGQSHTRAQSQSQSQSQLQLKRTRGGHQGREGQARQRRSRVAKSVVEIHKERRKL